MRVDGLSPTVPVSTRQVKLTVTLVVADNDASAVVGLVFCDSNAHKLENRYSICGELPWSLFVHCR